MFGARTSDDLPENGSHDPRVCIVVGGEQDEALSLTFPPRKDSPTS